MQISQWQRNFQQIVYLCMQFLFIIYLISELSVSYKLLKKKGSTQYFQMSEVYYRMVALSSTYKAILTVLIVLLAHSVYYKVVNG